MTWFMRPMAGSVLLLAAVLLFSAAALPTDRPDLSTPENAYKALVTALKNSDTEALRGVATPTGISSLTTLYTHEDFKDGLTVLGSELEQAAITWDKITDEIYMTKATHDGHTHKMEFTREEPGWMLYHWQLGGGVH